MRYHSPFMMKSDKSPPSSELSTRSSYQGQSLIKMGTYLHDGDISLGNSKPNVRMQLRILLASISTSTITRLRNGASTNRRYVIRHATKKDPFGHGAKKRRWFLSRAPCTPGKTRSCGRQAENCSLPSLKIAFRVVKKSSSPMEVHNLVPLRMHSNTYSRSVQNLKLYHVLSRIFNKATYIYTTSAKLLEKRKLVDLSFRRNAITGFSKTQKIFVKVW